MLKILWINPVGTDHYDAPFLEGFNQIKREDTTVDVVSLKNGPTHLEFMYYETMVLPEILSIVMKADREGYDAAVIGCFYDLGLHEAREVSEKMAIVAPEEACTALAATMGHRFSIIVTRDKCVPQMAKNLAEYGLNHKLASFKSLAIGVDDLHQDDETTYRRMLQCAKEAVVQDGAEVIVLGCTIQFGFYQRLQEEVGVPVIDAVAAPFKYAEYAADINRQFEWRHSKKCYYESPTDLAMQIK
ncbi:hydantoin racemase [Fusibacter paucivorans]|uniref:Hydantoin racemase n=1 Tax=Fusibacter paucivorans TaxID=76009 RepID=A0ABS5PQU0_9FIRM|nr:aspartate/glutamate racemase family protein [Fusibacter paucivorans]MBS7527495.1 hydantoin racemase [Fusibacter paucivorans]